MRQDSNRFETGQNPPKMASLALVAVGSSEKFDQIDPREIVQSAIESTGRRLGVIRARSAIYRTPAFPAGSGPDFVNAAFAVETDASAPQVLDALHAIEQEFGRTRSQRWGPRTLDLDLVGMDDLVIPDAATYQQWADLPLKGQMRDSPRGLILPHPRLQDRAFVLIPLCEVAPDWRHPILGKTVAEMARAMPQSARDEVEILQ
jgi:2-amino-4-hydroxy-6-hydroxymethyldihydropteridine diphosphokinase